MTQNWHQIWNKRGVTGTPASNLRDLMDLDGFDSGAGRVAAEDMRRAGEGERARDGACCVEQVEFGMDDADVVCVVAHAQHDLGLARQRNKRPLKPKVVKVSKHSVLLSRKRSRW